MKRHTQCCLALGLAVWCVPGTPLAVCGERDAPRFVLEEGSALMLERASTGGMSWVDFDHDGDDDLFVGNGYDVAASRATPQPNRLYENLRGTFVPLDNELSLAEGFSSGSAWADFDNDGRIDAFVPNQRGQDNFLYRNLGGGSFELLADSHVSTDGGSSFSGTWADVDADGWVDLFVANGGLSGSGRDRLYRNIGGRTFARVRMGPSTEDVLRSGGATFVDYDLDGDVDLFVPGAESRLYRNDGSGRFEIDADALFGNAPHGGVSTHGAWGDFDNDGDFDLFQIFGGDEPRRLYVNQGGGRFVRADAGDATRETSMAFHCQWADLDNDGFLDLVVANWGSPPGVYLNRRGRSLERVTTGELVGRDWFASMVAVSDYDRDGDLDLVVGNWPDRPGDGEANLLYRNEGPVGNAVALRLEGTCSNRSAIGARVEVVVKHAGESHTMTREVRSQDGWRSQSSLEVLVGIGEAEAADEVRVFWPSSRVQTVGPMKAGERRTLIEPSADCADLIARREAARTVPGPTRPGRPTTAAPPAVTVPSCDLTVDARTTPGFLRVSGTANLELTRRDTGTAIRFRLIAAAERVRASVVAPDGTELAAEPERVGGFGRGLNAVSVWEVHLEGRHFADGEQPLLKFAYEVSGTQEIFHVEPGLAFASGQNLPWHPQGASDRSVGRLRILAEPGASAIAAGRRTGTIEAEANGNFEFAIDRPMSLSFATGRWNLVRYDDGSVPIRIYRRARHRDGVAHAGRMARILETLELEFGAYPYREFAVVEVPAKVANDAGFGGVSLEGWMIAYEGAWPDGPSPCFFGHEIAHQWWGNQVRASPGVPDGLLDEGLANYAGHRTIAALQGAETASHYRQFGCDVMGWMSTALGYLAQVEAGEDRPLFDLGMSAGSETLKDNKLYFVWVELGRMLGEEAMRRGLHELARRQSGQSATWDDVIRSLSAGSGATPARLEQFFDQWLRRAGAPEVRLEWSQREDAVELVLRQTDPPYRLQVPLRIHGEGGETVDLVMPISESVAHRTVELDFPVWTVDLDPDYTFLRVSEELRRSAIPLGHYLRGMGERDLQRALTHLDRGVEAIPQPDLHSTRMFLEYGRGRVHARHRQWNEARDHLLAATQSPTRRADFLPTVYRLIAEVAVELDDRQLFDWAVASVLSADAAAGHVTSAPAYVEVLQPPSTLSAGPETNRQPRD